MMNFEMKVRGVMDIVRPLLDLAIDDLPLESWSVYVLIDKGCVVNAKLIF